MSVGGIIGRNNMPNIGNSKGIWSLREQCGFSLNDNWPSNLVLSLDGSSLTGFTNTGVTIDSSSIGNPLPSFSVTGSQRAYRDVGTSLLGKVITFDVYLPNGTTSLANFYFACNSAGAGDMLRLDTRTSTKSGFATTVSWTSWNAPTVGPILSKDVWLKIRIEIGLDGLATAYADSTLLQSGYAIQNLGSFIAIHGDGANTAVRFDNIKIY